jgi:DNA repair exonuclease SbcCD ATPase subunit
VRQHLRNLKTSLICVQELEIKIGKLIREKDICISNIDNYKKDIRMLYENLYSEKFDEAISEDTFYELISGKTEEIEKRLNELYAIANLNKQIALYQEKKRTLAQNDIRFKKVEADLQVKEKVYLDIQSVKKLYNIKYFELIKKELKQICDGEISAIYNAINQSNDEVVDKFIIEPNIESKEIEFSIQMKANSKRVSALEILSTGHLRCLGFALLVARIKVKVKNLGFIIVDDPIYSIDHEHRYNLIQYLKGLSDSYQLIITSSDRLFYDIIRNNFSNYSALPTKSLRIQTEIKVIPGMNGFPSKAP